MDVLLDLRNLLASSQLLSDQLSSVPDPRVQRFAPKLMRSLERAIAFCQSTLSYGRAQEAPPDRRMMLIEPVVNEVRAQLRAAPIFIADGHHRYETANTYRNWLIDQGQHAGESDAPLVGEERGEVVTGFVSRR